MRSSLIDFPDRIATVVFTGGCNFRCPMCHNVDLVLRPGSLERIDPEQIWSYLSRRVGIITGIVITGGEPTLQHDLPAFCRRARSAGVAVKFDTNGYRPEVLESLLDEGLLDYVAMDVKAPPGKYRLLTGCEDIAIERIERSLMLLRSSDISYELRTTVVPGLLEADDLLALAEWIFGAKRYVLQQFRGSRTLDPQLATLVPYSSTKLSEMADAVRRWIPEVVIRGV